jgi:hypothetical protein
VPTPFVFAEVPVMALARSAVVTSPVAPCGPAGPGGPSLPLLPLRRARGKMAFKPRT